MHFNIDQIVAVLRLGCIDLCGTLPDAVNALVEHIDDAAELCDVRGRQLNWHAGSRRPRFAVASRVFGLGCRHDLADVLRESLFDSGCGFAFRRSLGIETHHKCVAVCFVCGKLSNSAGGRPSDESEFLKAFERRLHNDGRAVGHHRHLSKNHWSAEPTDDFPH